MNCAQLLTIDQRRLRDRIGALDEQRLREVEEALLAEFGIVRRGS